MATHMAGMQQHPCNIFMVELPLPQTEKESEEAKSLAYKTLKHMPDDMSIVSEESVAYLIESVSFDDDANYFCSDWEQRHLIVFKDAFDFLRDVSPNRDCNQRISYKDNLIYIGEVESWSDFVSQKIEMCSTKMSPAEYVSILLKYLTSEGHRSVYDFPIKENYANKVKDYAKIYVTYKRGIRNQFHRLLNRNISSLGEKKLKREAILSTLGISSEVLRSLPLEVARFIESVSNRIEIKKVRSHIGASISVDYIGHLLRKYDRERYADYIKIVVLFGSSNPANMLVKESLQKHFNTENVYEVPSAYNGIELTIIQINGSD